MNYQILLNGSEILSGNAYNILFIDILLSILFIILIVSIFRRLSENESLKYEFITIIAHKFRTPLTFLRWTIEDLYGYESDQNRKKTYLEMQQSANNLINLTGSLIELTNTDAETKSLYKIEVIPVCDLVRTVTNAYRPFFHEKNITFSINCPYDEIFAKVDRTRTEFVLQTLLENSCSYTPTGRKVDVSVFQRRSKAIISVSDNGIGIKPEVLSKIFTKFYRAPNARSVDTEGFGIGLFLAQTIMKRQKCRIEAYSPGENMGSVFSMVLPRKRVKKPRIKSDPQAVLTQ